MSEFPREITFKAVFRTSDFVSESVRVLLSEKLETFSLSEKTSGGGKFISFTVSAHFECEEKLNALTGSVSSIEGFTLMV